MKTKKNLYVLSADGLSLTTEELPIILNIGSQFEHPLGNFYVHKIDGSIKTHNMIMCRRTVKETHLSAELDKGRAFEYKPIAGYSKENEVWQKEFED
jgi:hypothetical protein